MSLRTSTRKVTIYTPLGRSQGKPWWMSSTLLTCKSFAKGGCSGERLIESPGSWFSPKCPSGQLEVVIENLRGSWRW